MKATVCKVTANCEITVKAVGKIGSVNAVSAGITKNKITWKKEKNATGYQVYRSKSKNGPWKKVKTTKTGSYTDRNLKTGRKYYYKVRAYKKIGKKNVYGNFSGIKSVKVK